MTNSPTLVTLLNVVSNNYSVDTGNIPPWLEGKWYLAIFVFNKVKKIGGVFEEIDDKKESTRSELVFARMIEQVAKPA